MNRLLNRTEPKNLDFLTLKNQTSEPNPFLPKEPEPALILPLIESLLDILSILIFKVKR